MGNIMTREQIIKSLESSYSDIEVLFGNERNFLIFLFLIGKYFRNELTALEKRSVEILLNNFFNWLSNVETSFKNDLSNINNNYTVSMNKRKNFIIDWRRLENIIGGL